MQEPSLKKKPYAIYYHIITHSVRLTRELNNIHLEQENMLHQTTETSNDDSELILNCLDWYNKNIKLAIQVTGATDTSIYIPDNNYQPPFPLTQQQKLYLGRILIELKSMHQDMERLSNKVRSILNT